MLNTDLFLWQENICARLEQSGYNRNGLGLSLSLVTSLVIIRRTLSYSVDHLQWLVLTPCALITLTLSRTSIGITGDNILKNFCRKSVPAIWPSWKAYSGTKMSRSLNWVMGCKIRSSESIHLNHWVKVIKTRTN